VRSKVGGLAVSVRLEPRFTRDADVAVAVASDAEAEAVTGWLVAAGCQVTATAEPLVVLDGVPIPVAATAHLIAMKLLSRDDEPRPQDLVDARPGRPGVG